MTMAGASDVNTAMAIGLMPFQRLGAAGTGIIGGVRRWRCRRSSRPPPAAIAASPRRNGNRDGPRPSRADAEALALSTAKSAIACSAADGRAM